MEALTGLECLALNLKELLLNYFSKANLLAFEGRGQLPVRYIDPDGREAGCVPCTSGISICGREPFFAQVEFLRAQNAARLTVDSDALLCYNGRRGDAGMKLKLAKWCSIIPLFVYALCAAALLIFKVIAASDIDGGEVPLVAIIGYLLVFVSTVSYLLSIFTAPIPAILGVVFSTILIFQKERKAILFLILSCADIIISALLFFTM